MPTRTARTAWNGTLQDGSGQVERLCHMHTAADGCYRCEAHPAPSPDGRRVLFASNWSQDCLLCGSASDIKDYVVLDQGSFTVDVPTPVPGAAAPPVALALGAPSPNPATSRIGLEYTLPGTGRARLDVLNVAGRIVQHVDLGAPGPGTHLVTVQRAAGVGPGVYWVRLSQGGRRVDSKVVLVF
jgi:hypothetical protein